MAPDLERRQLEEPGRIVPFATTIEDPADQLVFAGIDDFAEIFVPVTGTTGFVLVALRTQVV